jgi:hypothetical protein
MDRLLKLDVDQYIAQMRVEVERTMREVADAVNSAPEGNVISGSEIAVRDAIRQLSRSAFEKAVQMRIDSTESSFSPSQGHVGPSDGRQGQGPAKYQHGQRSD